MKKQLLLSVMFIVTITLFSTFVLSYKPTIVYAQSNSALCNKLSDWNPYVNKKIVDLKTELSKNRATLDTEIKDKWQKTDTDVASLKAKEDLTITEVYKTLDTLATTEERKLVVRSFKQNTDLALKQRRANVDTAIIQSRTNFKLSFENQVRDVDNIIATYQSSLNKAVEESQSECLKNGITDPTVAQKIFIDKSALVTQKFTNDIASIEKLENMISYSANQFSQKNIELYDVYNKTLKNESLKLIDLFEKEYSNNVSKECNTFTVGYKVTTYNGVKSAVWYPSNGNVKSFDYGGNFSGNLAKDAKPLNNCGKFPLIVFSHGFAGCGTQSIFFTEELARNGYVVIAPDHKDALCSVDGSSPKFDGKQPSLLNPESWNDKSYANRKDDIKNIINGALNSDLKNIIDSNKIALAGHSLGGYTALGVAGGWESWKDNRVKAVLLMSPYTIPFTLGNNLKNVNIPVMYQGADFDIGITPFLEGKDGAYEKTSEPKYFVKLKGGNHFIWTNLQCAGQLNVKSCISAKPEAKIINDYAIGFFDLYLKGKNSSVFSDYSKKLSSYKFTK